MNQEHCVAAVGRGVKSKLKVPVNKWFSIGAYAFGIIQDYGMEWGKRESFISLVLQYRNSRYHTAYPCRCCCCLKLTRFVTRLTSPPQSHLGRTRRYPSRQRLDLLASCATSCVIPTADESNHSATGTLHPHGNATCVLYVTLR